MHWTKYSCWLTFPQWWLQLDMTQSPSALTSYPVFHSSLIEMSQTYANSKQIASGWPHLRNTKSTPVLGLLRYLFRTYARLSAESSEIDGSESRYAFCEMDCSHHESPNGIRRRVETIQNVFSRILYTLIKLSIMCKVADHKNHVRWIYLTTVFSMGESQKYARRLIDHMMLYVTFLDVMSFLNMFVKSWPKYNLIIKPGAIWLYVSNSYICLEGHKQI